MPSPARSKKKRSILPGFGLTMGYTMLYVSLLVVIPLAGLFVKSAALSWPALWKAITSPALLASLKITFKLSLIAAIINGIFGFIVAWTLVRYPFPGRKFIDGLIDLPFALPTAVSGITLATLYTDKGWLGKPFTAAAPSINSFLHATGLSAIVGELPRQVAYSQLGMLIALIFIGLPFVVRTLEPALADLDPEVEEAAASLGASRSQAFWRVIAPALLPAFMTGFSLAFARALGEYGSVVFISSGRNPITAQLIVSELENNNYPAATALGAVMLLAALVMLGLINYLQWWSARRSRVAA